MLSQTAIQLINLWQKTLSPDHGKVLLPISAIRCKFYPSCSEYTKTAIIRQGFLRGLVLGLWRLLRCNPLSLGGYDPV